MTTSTEDQGVLVPYTRADQFRLVRLQVYNWGTFQDNNSFDIAPEGYLITGPNGGGKSTLLDAHSTILTPPSALDFNVAARDSGERRRDRTWLTYVRGAWKHSSVNDTETATDYLRASSTMSAVAETFQTEGGKVVTLVCVLWIRGSSNEATQVRRGYLALQRSFDLKELQFFPNHDFDVKRFKVDLAPPDNRFYTEFSEYEQRACTLLDIRTNLALRLLHKTQSAKPLGEIDEFFRSFMLDEPTTFDIADALVTEFVDLDAAHKAVVDARLQRDMLAPAKELYDERESLGQRVSELKEAKAGLGSYRNAREQQLLTDALAAERLDESLAQQSADEADGKVTASEEELTRMRELRANMGGSVIAQLEIKIKALDKERPLRIGKRDKAAKACDDLDWEKPKTAEDFIVLQSDAQDLLNNETSTTGKRDDEIFVLRTQIKNHGGQIKELQDEYDSLAVRRSLIPSKLQNARVAMLRELNLADDEIPFAGELIEVKKEEFEWSGAIERVLGGLARSLLVEEKHYKPVSDYINRTNTGQRLLYLRMEPMQSGKTMGSPRALIRKLTFLDCPYKSWLIEWLKTRFDFECVDDVAALRSVPRAVTKEGQIKGDRTRHMKDDMTPIHRRDLWVLGFENSEKLATIQTIGLQLASELAGFTARLNTLNDETVAWRDKLMACNTLINYTWSDIDVESVITEYARLQAELRDVRAANPDLDQLTTNINALADRVTELTSLRTDAQVKLANHRLAVKDYKRRLEESLAAPLVALTPTQQSILHEAFEKRTVTHANLERESHAVERALDSRVSSHELQRSEFASTIVATFVKFNGTWAMMAANLVPSIDSAGDYFALLNRLIKDNLPAYEKRFLKLLHDSSDQNLGTLQNKLKDERRAIDRRLESVNDGLKASPFNSDKHSHLDIKATSIHNADVAEFNAKLREILSHSFSDDQASAERRFGLLSPLIKRLGSKETADLRWRALVLDVRRHVDFKAKEVDQDGVELDVFSSGDGKSGGQRQKLTSTILASALRYQLVRQDQTLPSYSTVVLDEAFSKSDNNFATLAINVFKEFGFQMVFATPLAKVSSIEHFIGGAAFVHIEDRKRSCVKVIDYDHDDKRLKMTHEMLQAAADEEREPEAA